jgi:hypothetical protein
VETGEMRALIFNPEAFDPRRDLLLEPSLLERAGQPAPPRLREPDDVIVQEYRFNRSRVAVKVPGPGYLSIAETYAPGWRAWVDGKETRLLRANYAFQAVPLSGPGPRQVVLEYIPLEFRLGLWVSLPSLALWLCLLAGAMVKKRGLEIEFKA